MISGLGRFAILLRSDSDGGGWVLLTVISISRINHVMHDPITRLTRDIDIAIMSVCLSVRHVPVGRGNGLTYCHSFFTTR